MIATRVGGIPEVVEDRGCGFLFEVGDIDGMSRAALEVLKDDAVRKRLGARGREIAISNFNTDRIIPQYERLYKRLIESGRQE